MIHSSEGQTALTGGDDMPLATEIARFTPEEYLEWEKGNQIKHEYVNGEVFALAGAKDAHVTVAGNLFVQLHTHLRGRPCRLYMSDMRVSVESENVFYYPDLMVTCDQRDRESDYFKRFPTLIVEVLSESTAASDRGKKFSSYRKLDSLREYVLIDPDSLNVDCFRLDESTGHWVLYPYGAGEAVEFASVGMTVPIEELYENVFPAEGAAEEGPFPESG
jgi:Uma2 family endonuclease